MTLPLGDDENLFVTVKFQTHFGRSGTINRIHRMLDLTNISVTHTMSESFGFTTHSSSSILGRIEQILQTKIVRDLESN